MNAVEATGEPAEPTSASVLVGQRLRQSREAQGLSLGDVARQLKLSVRQVESLERGDIDGFPSLVFVRGFLRNYARLVHVGLDADISRIQPPAPPETVVSVADEPLRQPETAGRSGRAIRVLGGVLMVAVVAVFVAVHQLGKEHPVTDDVRSGALPNPGAPTNPGAPPPGLASNPALATSQMPQAPGEPSGAPAPDSAPQAASPVANPDGDMAAPPSAGETAPASNPETTTPGNGGELLAGTASATVTGSEVKLQFDAEAWVEIKDQAGKVVFAQLNKPGSEQIVAGEGPLTLVVGNARHVRVYYQGDPVDLAPHTRLDVARLTLQ